MDLHNVKRDLFGEGFLASEEVKKLYGRLKSLTANEIKVSTVFATRPAQKTSVLASLDLLFKGEYQNWKQLVDVKDIALHEQYHMDHNFSMFIRLFQNKKIVGTSYLPYYEHYLIFGYNASGTYGQSFDDLSLDSVTSTLELATVNNWFGPIMKNFVTNAPIQMAVMVLNSYPTAAVPIMQLATRWAQKHLDNYDAPMKTGSIAMPYQNGKYACPFCLYIGDEDQMVLHIATCLLLQCGVLKTKASYRCSQQYIDNYYKAVIGTKDGLKIVDSRDYRTVGYMTPYHTWSNFSTNVNNTISVHSLNSLFTKSDSTINETVVTMFAVEDSRVKLPCFACDYSYMLNRPCALSLKFSGHDTDCIVCRKPGGKVFSSIEEFISITLGMIAPEPMDVQQREELLQDRTLIKNVVDNVSLITNPIHNITGPICDPMLKIIKKPRALQILAAAALPTMVIKGLMAPVTASVFSSFMGSLGVSTHKQYHRGITRKKYRGKRKPKGRSKPKRLCVITSHSKQRPRCHIFNSLFARHMHNIVRRVEISAWMEHHFGKMGIAFVRHLPLIEPGTIGFG